MAEVKPIRVLVRDLFLTALLAGGLYVLFTVFNTRFLTRFSAPEVLLLEAGAIVLVAWLAARALTASMNAVLKARGQAAHGHAVRIFVNLLLAVAVVLALFKLAGVSAESIFLGSAFAGIVLGLAAQTVLANVFAGLLLVLADPFRPGDRVAFISSSYGAIAPSYPHEMMYPGYPGTVEDVGLIYTVLRLDAGSTAKVPNSVVLSALILQPERGAERAHRIRMTFPLTVSVPTVEACLAEVQASFPSSARPAYAPRVSVVDISAATWDGLIVTWSKDLDEDTVRDRVLRAVLRRLPAAATP